MQKPPQQLLDPGDLLIQRQRGLADFRGGQLRSLRGSELQLHRGFHPGQRVQDLMRQLRRDLADGGQLLILDEAAALLQDGGIGLF